MASKKLYYYHVTAEGKEINISELVYKSSLENLVPSHDVETKVLGNGVSEIYVDDILTYLVCKNERAVEDEIMNLPKVQSKELTSSYKKDVALIKRELEKVESSFLNIGFSLHRIYKSGGFSCDGYSNVYEFAKDKFNLARGTTNNFINVVETFGKRVDGKFMDELEDKYKGFKSSQLIALLGYVNRGGTELDCFTADMSVRDVKSKIKELECSSCEDDSEVVEVDGSEVVVPAKECKNTLISCMGLDDYNRKVDEIDALILNMFNKSKKRVRIEIVAIEY